MPLEYFITPKCHLLKTIHLFISFSESEILKEFSYMDLALTFHMTMHFISLRCSHLQGQQSWRSIFKDVYTLGDCVSLWLRAADLSFLHMVLNTCPSRLPFKKSMRIGNNSTTCLSCPALPSTHCYSCWALFLRRQALRKVCSQERESELCS